jgi:type IV secretion system protein VirB8
MRKRATQIFARWEANMATTAKPSSARSDQELYLAEARSWESDRNLQMRRSVRTAWTAAVIGAVLALAAIGALVGLTPLKQTELKVLRVNETTGAVDVVNALKDGKENYDEAVNKYFIQWYVRYREGYAKDLAEEYYYNTGLMSGGIEQQRYFDSFNPKNPRSPINVFGAYAKVKTKIKSTSFISPTVALVRYTKEIERGTDRPQISHWAATVTFRYTAAPMSERDRGVNPLGFQVIDYRNDPDTGNDVAYDPLNPQPAQPEGPTVGVTLAPGERVEVPAVAPTPDQGAGSVPAIR